MAVKPKNNLYKKHLIDEGKNEGGIYQLLLRDYRKSHKSAIEVLVETGQERVTHDTIKIAVIMIMRQFGLKP